MNPTASKMKLFMILIDDLIGKQLNNIIKNPISDAAEVLDYLSIHYFKETCVIYLSF